MKRPIGTAVVGGLALSLLTAGPAFAQPNDDSNRDIARYLNELRQDRNRGNDRTIAVTTFADSVDADLGDGICADDFGECSLRSAIQTANAGTGQFDVKLRRGTYVLTIPGTDADGAEAGDLDVTGEVNLDGKRAVVELGDLNDRAFDVAPDARLSVRRLTVQNGSPAEGASGGAFRNAGELVLDDVTAVNNVVVGAGASGGAIVNTGALKVTRSTLSGNSAIRAGGAIEANGGTTIVDRTTLSRNAAGPMPGNGGALHLTGAGYVEVTRSTVTANTAASEGGGLWNSATGTMVVSRTNLLGNVANGSDADNGGGALFNDGGNLAVESSIIDDNRAPMGSGSGGGILNNGGTLDVTRSSLRANRSQRAGGGIETVNGTVTVDKSILSSNATGPAPGNGGGVHVSGTAAMVTIEASVVANNTAALEGGGLWAGAGDSVMVVNGSSITGNTANGTDAINGGGGLFNKGGQLTVNFSDVSRNSAVKGSGSGGGILNLGTLDVTASLIRNNSSARAGGGIESNEVNGAGDATLSNVSLLDNFTGNAPGNGGGMHVTGSSVTTLIDRSLVTGNRAANEGGGLWNFEGATMTVTASVVTRNSAPVGPNVFQNGAGGNFTVNGFPVPPGGNDLSFPPGR